MARKSRLPRFVLMLAIVPISVLVAILVVIDPGISSPMSPLYCSRPAAILSAVTLASGSFLLIIILSRKDVRIHWWHLVLVAFGVLTGVLLCSLYASEVSYRSGIPVRSSVFRGLPFALHETGTEAFYETATPYSRFRRLALVTDSLFYAHVGVVAVSATRAISKSVRRFRRKEPAVPARFAVPNGES